jgi:hypothetical protein
MNENVIALINAMDSKHARVNFRLGVVFYVPGVVTLVGPRVVAVELK